MKIYCLPLFSWMNILNIIKAIMAEILCQNSFNYNSGLKTIQQRRGIVTEKPVLLTGPGKVIYNFFFLLLYEHSSIYPLLGTFNIIIVRQYSLATFTGRGVD